MLKIYNNQFSSVQFSCSIKSNSLQRHGPRHTRPPFWSPVPGVYSNSSQLSWWYNPTISSSVVPLYWLQYFPASGSFPMSQFFTSGGQSIGVSASASVLPMNSQDWFSLGLRVQVTQQSSPTPQFKNINSSALSFLYSRTLTSIHDHWKNYSLN